jgi:hypothetical protein
MGYACPVCAEPQVDAEHLANHLAFTAILRGRDHELWLDEQVENWGDMEPAELAEAVVEDAEEIEIEGVEETAHAETRPEVARDRGGMAGQQTPSDRLSAEDQAVLEEARELTRQMLESSAGERDADANGDPGGQQAAADERLGVQGDDAERESEPSTGASDSETE